MKYSTAQLKAVAKQQMRGNYPIAILIMFILYIASYILTTIATVATGITSTTSMFLQYAINDYPVEEIYTTLFSAMIPFTILSLVVSFLLGILSAGQSKFYLNVALGKTASINDLGFPFTNHPLKFYGLQFIVGILPSLLILPVYILTFIFINDENPIGLLVTSLLGIILLVAEVVLNLMFSQTTFLYLENPEKPIIQIIKESIYLMKGNKGRFFWLSITFIPLVFVATLFCGIGLLWVQPYMMATNAVFFLEITNQLPPDPFQPTGGNQWNNGGFNGHNQNFDPYNQGNNNGFNSNPDNNFNNPYSGNPTPPNTGEGEDPLRDYENPYKDNFYN